MTTTLTPAQRTRALSLYNEYNELLNQLQSDPDNEELSYEIADYTGNLLRNNTSPLIVEEVRRLIQNPPEDEGAGVASPPIGGRKSRKSKSRKTLKKKRSTRRKHLKKV